MMNGKFLPVILAGFFLAFGMVSCGDVENTGGSSCKSGDVAIPYLKLGTEWTGYKIQKTGEYFVIPAMECLEITGSDLNLEYSYSGSASRYATAFPEGRKVRMEGFVMAQHEVSQLLWGVIMDESPSECAEGSKDYPNNGEEKPELRPVENVTWYEAIAFCNKLTEIAMVKNLCCYFSDPDYKNVYTIEDARAQKKVYYVERSGYRLPTEAEWEIAARGGVPGNSETWLKGFSGQYCSAKWGDGEDEEITDALLDKVGWYRYNLLTGSTSTQNVAQAGNPGYGTHEIGMKDENSIHLKDMSGNVAEWCWDAYSDDVCSSDEDCQEDDGFVFNPKGPEAGEKRVVRGGSFLDDARDCTVFARSSAAPDSKSVGIGFRLARFK